MTPVCRGCGRPVDPIRIFCTSCGRRIVFAPPPGVGRIHRRSRARPSILPPALVGMVLGGAAGFFVQPAGSSWPSSARGSYGVLSQLLGPTAQGAFFRMALLAAAGLLIGALIGYLRRNQP